MLETVKQKIKEVEEDTRTFNQYFIDYIQEVQDQNIELELSTLRLKNPKLNSTMIARLLAEEYKEVQ